MKNKEKKFLTDQEAYSKYTTVKGIQDLPETEDPH